MNKSFTVMFIAGARPNFMKIAPIVRAIHGFSYGADLNTSKQPKVKAKIVHTGQHYDKIMSEVFFQELGIPEPDYNLEVGSGSHAIQTANVMTRFEKVLEKDPPDLVIVVGDVNSTIACSLTAKKLGFEVAHIEAGLRSFDMDMPEEINRKLTDCISDHLFVTEQAGIDNLRNEGISEKKIYFVGNVMIDTLTHNIREVRKRDFKGHNEYLKLHEKQTRYAVLTLHRPSNVDDPAVFKNIWNAVNRISTDIPIIFPAHPRTRAKLGEFGLKKSSSNLIITEPIGYLDMLRAIMDADLVLTDSGGLQEETTFLKVPCITIRENTERPSTIEMGTNILVGTKEDNIVDAAMKIIRGQEKDSVIPPLWDGKASERIARILVNNILNKKNS